MKINSLFCRDLSYKSGRITTIVVFFLLLGTISTQRAVARQTDTATDASVSLSKSYLPGDTAYTLGPGDRIRVDIFQVDKYSNEYLVLIDGTVSLPLIGRLNVQGLTLSEMAKLVGEQYAPYLKRPLVTVTLLTPRPMKIAIAGEINRPGSYEIKLDKDGQFPSVTDIIQQAGGITTVADVRQVQIRRYYRGRQQVFTANLWELFQKGNLNEDINLRDGDSVFIPTADKIDPNETRQLADANFGIQVSQPITVAVVGEVYRPGSYKIAPEERSRNIVNSENFSPQPPRLTQAIKEAGGIKLLADIRNVEIRRFMRNGSQQKIDVDLWELLQTGNINDDLILQEGDTVFIPTAKELNPTESESLALASFAPDQINVNVVGEVMQPGVVKVAPNTPLNQALLAAGNFNPVRANRASVDLIRLNPNGTVTTRSIEVDFANDLNSADNPAMRNNDVIVVRRSALTVVTDGVSKVLSPFLTPFNSVFNVFR